MIRFASGNAAGSEHEIVVPSCRSYLLAQNFGIVGENSEIARLHSEFFQEAKQQITVRVIQRSGPKRLARLYDFVAGRKQRNANAALHLDLVDTDGGGERNILRLKASAARNCNRARPQIFACQTPIRAEFKARGYDHRISFDAAVFLHIDGVRSRGHGRAGENAGGLPWSERAGWALACKYLLDDFERCIGARAHVAMAHGITIDGG